ncbi:MAG: PQQ-binding-like beta-propeller repeat protein, partial [Acidobacteriota bacterium]|nr:PQQ-binding-like beta-propeller repeat protein [Acidobacteriota bacterium]
MKRLATVSALIALVAPAAATAQEDAGPSLRPVTWERLLNAADEPENWLMYSGTLDSKRYSRLDQIHNRNVGNLELKWAYQIPEIDRAETTPLVVDGVMFVTEAPSNVVALDAATGRQYWRYNHDLPDDLRICCGRNNRGVAILGETLFMSTLDAHIVAIDARTGNVVWDTETAPHTSGYSKTAAPLIVKDQVITGIAGGEYGIRGFLDSYDPASGVRNWRTYTIPGPDEPGNQTWLGESWRTGGSPTWITGAYDPDLDLIYWGIGNPGPDWNGEVRLGDNLYSDSVLALNGDGGNLEWYFQFTPHDIHDWDAIQVPILADIMYEGEMRKAML